MIVEQLVSDIGICDQLTAEYNEVSVAGLDKVDSGLGSMGTCIEQGLVGCFSCRLADVLHGCSTHVHGRIDVLDRLVAACIYVERINAMLCKNLENDLAVLKSTTAGDSVVKRQTEDNGDIITCAAVDCINNIGCELYVFFGGTAVFIGSVIPDGRQKLVDEVADVCVNFDAVEACVTDKTCAVLPLLHNFLNFLNGECVALYVGVPNPSVFGRRVRRFSVNLVCITAGAAAELREDLTTVCFASVSESACRGNHMVMIPVVSKNALTEVGGEISLTDDDHTCATLCAGFKVCDFIFRECTVAVGHQGAHCGHDNAVFNFTVADTEWSK